MDAFTIAVENVLLALDNLLGSALYFPYVLLGVGCFFTIYLGFPQVRYFKRAWGVLLGRHTRPDAEGDTSHLQALSTALSGTVGTGNIGGVALAIFLGGPAALFWMWATAFVGMTTKFVEVTISHKYRVKDDKGEIAGGPMYFMERGLNMKWLAVFFAAATVLSTIGSGNMPQSNNMAEGLYASFDIPTWASGVVLAGLLALVIIGGIKRIARVATAIVPAMGILYAVGAFAVLATNYHEVGPAFLAVFEDAFTGSAASGGFLGATFAYAFNRGVNRGLFSNEAGQGSAPIAHASARADEPVSEGLVSILEPFLDTLVICTLTGIVILSSGAWKDKFDNEFDGFDTVFVAGAYTDSEPQHVASLHAYLNGVDAETVTLDGVAYEVGQVERATGAFAVVDGRIEEDTVTILHKRSVAEDVRFLMAGGSPFSGTVDVENGALATPGVTLRGKSLVHSVRLTSEAFKRSFFGDYGQYAVTIGLVLFAFSTAIAWSYYGDRAITYLFGTRWVMPYRAAYVLAFFLATVLDTSLVWLVSAVTLALMALPNLLGIVLLAREMKAAVRDYWQD
ncbi:MAG: sodium:alanine symporter family protein [Gammaproteobacteria bacterium]|nr:sodium:alanine symporter family protein [Gammaproteobacteria bacterium]MYK48264.1 sodium:alanine symporter family protein [Gammaproteobacteria bacterium]